MSLEISRKSQRGWRHAITMSPHSPDDALILATRAAIQI